VIGILPGSRTREVNDLMPIFRRLLDGMDLPKDSHHVLVSCCRKEFEPVIAGALDGCRLPWRMVADDSRAVAAASDFVLVKSGTASLETAYFARPMLVLYRASALERFLYRLLAVTPFFALPNILGASLTGGEPLVPERLCRGDEGADLAPLVLPLLAEDGARSLTVERLRRLRETYLAPGATARAAAAFLDFLAEQA
jgi:lipid-A-disaccharide synthase